jgi:hypothetical protein
MMRKVLFVIVLFVFISCGPTVWFPPEIDLIPYGQVGLISFSLENAEGPLDKMATQRFLQDITYHQRGVQIIELGTLEEGLAKIRQTISSLKTCFHCHHQNPDLTPSTSD